MPTEQGSSEAAAGGTAEHFGLEGQVDIIMGTMGKALGCFGAFVAGSSELRDYLINRARTFIYTTALPPAVIASALEAIELLEKEPQKRQALWDNASFFRKGLQDLGFNILESTTQIIPVLVGDASYGDAPRKRSHGGGAFYSGNPPAHGS